MLVNAESKMWSSSFNKTKLLSENVGLPRAAEAPAALPDARQSAHWLQHTTLIFVGIGAVQNDQFDNWPTFLSGAQERCTV